jgi:hypothetical protein
VPLRRTVASVEPGDDATAPTAGFIASGRAAAVIM